MIARLLIGLGLIVLTLDVADLKLTGLTLLAAALMAAGWLVNVEWVADEETSARLAAVDAELEANGL